VLRLNLNPIYEVWQRQGGPGAYWSPGMKFVDDDTNVGAALTAASEMVDPNNQFALYPGAAIVHWDPSANEYVTDVEPQEV